MESLESQVINWLATGERGTSSETMAFRFLGRKRAARDERAPSDPDDLRRCLLLLAAIPAGRLHMDKLRDVNETWARMVDRWDEMETLFLKETGGTLYPAFGASCPETYKLMQILRYGKVIAPGLHIETE